MNYLQTELLNRKAELNEKILKAIESARAHGISLRTISADTGIDRSTVLALRKHRINEVSFDQMYMLAIGLGITVNITVPRVMRA